MKGLLNKYIYLFLIIPFVISCDKNDPITELGDSNGQFLASLSVSYSNSKPALGDTVLVTASTWQRDDKISKVEMTETVVENFGLNFTLTKGTNISTFDAEKKISLLKLTDTISKSEPWFVVNNQNKELDQYFITLTNNYVIRARYPFKHKDGKYKNDVSVFNELTNDEFAVIKSILAYQISQADYKAIFPTSPASHFSTGTYALSNEGMVFLKASLTKELLIQHIASVKKAGTYSSEVFTHVTTPSGAVKSSNTTFQVIL
ncbi:MULTISPECIES: hypothetical protein [Sphingobacterium]|uniref:hypothetical protein n=1 Tax=Sphingobacterium TaxID=28453 RepID=UPI0013DBA92B|nr:MULTISPECIES: hypothetical protein [unclassified Sphingobacterium]